MNDLYDGKINTEFIISEIRVEKDDMRSFLFSLGCFVGGSVKTISRLSNSIIISIKGAKYCIDRELAKVIIIE